jgi:hypothetical protein
MTEQRFPKGWDEQRVQQLLAELDSRTEEEWVAADEAAASVQDDQAVVTVPVGLLPEIRRLLAAYKPKSA